MKKDNTLIEEQTIIAQCTPNGDGTIALLRLSGNNVRTIIAKMSKLPGKKVITEVPSHTVHYGWIVDEKKLIVDQVLFIVMDGPKTFTGESIVEITCHNNPFLIEEIIKQAIIHGARLAQPGEFSRRAFLNKKIDLLQAEAINEILKANTQATLKKSLEQIEGSFSSWIAKIEEKLFRALAFCEASFEFIDEEAEFKDTILKNVNEILLTIESIKKTFGMQQQIRQGIRIALIGSVNAGKSSIFNALIGQVRAIVSSIEGTTRDTIEAGLYKNNNYWTLIDTAGLRQARNVIEKEGIKLSWKEAHKADVILLVIDGSKSLSLNEKAIYKDILSKWENKVILIKNKHDLPKKNHFLEEKSLNISVTLKPDIDKLESEIEKKISSLLKDSNVPFLLNKRQFNLLVNLERSLTQITNMLVIDTHYELIAYHLKDALSHLSELTGKTISEIGMDRIFKEFCVGK